MGNSYGQFWLRKLHSLCGFMFIGLFLIFHFIHPGMNIFDKGFLITLLIFSIPLVFHAIYGLYIIYEGKIQFYLFLKNWQYLLQRATGLIVFIFLPVHIYIMETGTEYIYDHRYLIFWIVGIIAAVSHLTNGMFGFFIHWGITIGGRSQRVVSILSILFFLMISISSINAFSEITGGPSFINSIYRFFFA